MTSLGENIHSRYDSIFSIDTEGMTSLFQARHRVLGTLHALRVMRQPAGEPHRLRETFLDLARLQARLRHPAWVRVHNVFEEADIAVVASDFTEGVTLDKHLAAVGALDVVVAAGMVATLAEAVAELHELGAAHHELRPGLIIVGGNGEGVKITHLSMSLQFTGEGPAVPYASPEELAHPGAGDGQADVHALGAILHHAVTGLATEPSLLRVEALNRRRSGKGFARFTSHVGLGAIIRAATADRLDARTNDPRELATVLNGWVQRQSTSSDDDIDLGVPEPEPGEEAEVEPAPAPPPPMPVKARAAFPTKWVAIGAGVLLGLGMVAAIAHYREARRMELALAQARDRAARSVALTDEALRMLERHKSDFSANKDASLLSSALESAIQAVASAPSPRALGVQALAKTWVDGWHMGSFDWDGDHFRRANASTALAAEGGSAEGLLARAMVVARACKVLDVSDGSRAGHCEEAGSLFVRANASLAESPATWLRFEAIWTATAYYNHMAAAATAAGEAGASQASIQAMALCAQGRAILEASPANDRILERECVRASGASGRYTDYFMWANLLQDDDLSSNPDLSSETVKLMYTTALPACSTLVVNKKNPRRRSLPYGTEASPSYTFCYAAGLKALGCPEQANVVIGQGQWLDGSLPWSSLLEGEGFRECYLDAR